MWADADDVLLPEAISKKANFLQLHPNFRIVRNNAVFCNELLQSMNQFAICPECPEGDNLFEALFLGKTSCLAGTYMMTMELFKESYDELWVFMEKDPRGRIAVNCFTCIKSFHINYTNGNIFFVDFIL